LAILHQDLADLEYAKYIPNTLSSKELEPFDYSVIGHYHDRYESDRFLYVGSTYPLSFKQAEIDKGIYILTINNDKSIQKEFIKLTNHKHKLKQIYVNYDSFTYDIIDNLIDNGFDVIKIILCTKESTLEDATLLAKDIRSKYTKKLEKLIIDFDIQERLQKVDDSIQSLDIQQDQNFVDLVKERYPHIDKSQVDLLFELFESYDSPYKSENKSIQYACQLIEEKVLGADPS
jgi:DNA repair exonuclease SbcCD nuclease subunit